MGTTDLSIELGRPHGRRDRHHGRRQPRRRPGAALHPLGCGRGELPDRVDAAHLRPADQRVEGRRRRCSSPARSGARPRRTSPSPSSGACASSCRAGSSSVATRPVRARSAPSSRSTSRRSARQPEVRHRQGHPHHPSAAAAAATPAAAAAAAAVHPRVAASPRPAATTRGPPRLRRAASRRLRRRPAGRWRLRQQGGGQRPVGRSRRAARTSPRSDPIRRGARRDHQLHPRSPQPFRRIPTLGRASRKEAPQWPRQ